MRSLRRAGQGDEEFRATIMAEIFRDRVTRKGIQRMVADLTGFEVRMFEPVEPEGPAASTRPISAGTCLAAGARCRCRGRFSLRLKTEQEGLRFFEFFIDVRLCVRN